MGACVSKQQEFLEQQKPPIAAVIGGGKDESANPMVSMSFLKKYSFATVNPAFADFENMQRNNPEEEEAICKLRILAQESFGGANLMASPARFDRRVSFFQDSSHRCAESMSQEVNGLMMSRKLEIEELSELPPLQLKRSSGKSRGGLSQARISEEKLVMSSSCMPNYSLGVVVNPEVRKAQNRRA